MKCVWNCPAACCVVNLWRYGSVVNVVHCFVQGWERLTDAVIHWINNNLSCVVFLLWGAYAQKKGAFINQKKHCVLKSPHPSPLSASRGFFGCNHFVQVNEYLEEKNKKPIDWSYLPKGSLWHNNGLIYSYVQSIYLDITWFSILKINYHWFLM